MTCFSAGVTALALAAACASPRDDSRAPNGCNQCHGSALNAAPPGTADGATATSDVGVGAHQVHVRDTPIRAALACSECHVLHTADEPPWHFGAEHGTVVFGTLASARGATPRWDRDTATCSGVYCHGATLRTPPAGSPTWTFTAEPVLSPPSPELCGRCHGYPPAAPHPQLSACSACHPLTVASSGTIDVAGGHHVDGRLDVRVGSGGCDLCHGYPPDDPGHRAHAIAAGDPARATYGSTALLQDLAPQGSDAAGGYGFGCGHCHPIDDARHMDGHVDVELWSAAAAPGSLKARAAQSAAYGAGTCSGVYCHSSGQASPAFVATPPWTSGTQLGCDGCHGNPPRYPSGGAGAADANSHLVLASDGYESGHFGGFPSAWHSSTHGAGGGQDASVVTCQTCHFDTVDPRDTGPSGFYALDTSGDYVLANGRLGYRCEACHAAGGAAPSGGGHVLPLRHVNGTRDVVFDRRTALPPYAALPAAPNTPTRPYWKANAGLAPPLPQGMAYDGTTLSLELSAATYAPATKTCSNVACHLRQTSVAWGGPEGWDMCGACHVF